MRRAVAVPALSFAFLLLLPLLPARACSCAFNNARETLASADGAFNGVFLESHPGEPPTGSSADDTIYTFQVEEAFKGALGETVEVHSPASDISCGLAVSPGETYGLFLYLNDDAEWSSGLCSQVHPDDLRAAAQPLPEPDGKNPLRFMAGGAYGEGRTLGLDARGRTLAYGLGRDDAGIVSACPGGRYVVETIYEPDRPRHARLLVRRLSDFSVRRRIPLPFDAWYSNRRPDLWELLCRDRGARSILVFGTTYHRHSDSKLIEVTPSGIDTLHKGNAYAAHLTSHSAFLMTGVHGRRIEAFALDTGVTEVVRTYRTATQAVALSPTGRLLSVVTGDFNDEAGHRLHLIDLNSGGDSAISLGLEGKFYFTEAMWADNDTLVLAPRGGEPSQTFVFDRDLHRIGKFGWDAYGGSTWDGKLYGIDWNGQLWKAKLPDGSPQVVNRLVMRSLATLEVVPGDTSVEPGDG